MQNKENSQPSGSSYLTIGSGRVARHLSFYFEILKIPFQTWNRSQPLEELSTKLLLKPTVLLAISDQALFPFYQEHLQGFKVVHFSGALHFPDMIACHPLMTFGPTLYDLSTYQNIHFALTGASSLQEIIPELSNPSFVMRAEDKALYHALCVLSGAGTQTLWSLCQKQLQSLNVPPEAFLGYIRQIFNNYQSLGAQGQTGPWGRKDLLTIQNNLMALEERNPLLMRVYQLLQEGHHDNH